MAFVFCTLLLTGLAVTMLPATTPQGSSSGAPRIVPQSIQLLEQLPTSWEQRYRERIPALLRGAHSRLRYDTMQILQDPSHPLVQAALLAAGALGDKQFKPGIERLMSSSSASTRALAYEIFDHFEPWAAKDLEAAFQQEDEAKMAGLISALGRRAPRSCGAWLLRGAIHPSELVRFCALTVLPKRLHGEALSCFLEVASKGELRQKECLLHLLQGREKTKSILSGVMFMLSSENASLRWQAVDLIKSQGVWRGDASPLLRLAIQSEDEMEKLHALDCIEKTQAQITMDALLPLLDSSQPCIAYRTARLLYSFGLPSAVARMLDLWSQVEKTTKGEDALLQLRSELESCLRTISGRGPRVEESSWQDWWAEQDGDVPNKPLPPSHVLQPCKALDQDSHTASSAPAPSKSLK
ncbi:MAG: hypothetical protein CSA62_00950 [Planctomycetota bacterium]|nr:MAG: hypothetical protein CSA62_00950 [Planctomycetota bacterium]